MPTQPETPFVYDETLPQVRRTFTLHRDRVEIVARWTLGREFRSTVKLADLSPQPRRFTVRNKWFKHSILVGSIAVGLALLASRSNLPRWVLVPCWAAAGVAFSTAVRSFSKRQFARFLRKDGKPGLDICKTDPEAFEALLREIQARIRKA